MGNVFFAKLKPQGFDAFSICRDLQRVVCGYPLWKSGSDLGSDHQSVNQIANLRNMEGKKRMEGYDYPPSTKMLSVCRNIAQQARSGDFFLIPRLREGNIYVARVTSPYDVFDPSNIVDRVKSERKRAMPAKPEGAHGWGSVIGDFMQGWKTEPWVAVRFVSFPRELAQFTFRRDSIGMLKRRDGVETWDTVSDLISGGGRRKFHPVSSVEQVEQGLRDLCSADMFEHLCVALLQLEHPDEVWLHVGGSGDGGMDGIGFSRSDGEAVAGLQCKLRWPGDEWVPPASKDGITRMTFASLIHGPRPLMKSGTFLGSREVAEMVLSHRARLPFAVTLGLKEH